MPKQPYNVLHYPALDVDDGNKYVKRIVCGNLEDFAVDHEWGDSVHFPSRFARYTTVKSKVTCKRCMISLGIKHHNPRKNRCANTFTHKRIRLWKTLFDKLLSDPNYDVLVASKTFAALNRKVHNMKLRIEEDK